MHVPQFGAELPERRAAAIHVVGAPLDGLAAPLQVGHRLPMFGGHLFAYRGSLFGKRPLLAQQLVVEFLGFGLGLGEPGLCFVELSLSRCQQAMVAAR